VELDLFESYDKSENQKEGRSQAPLAERLRPKFYADLVGHVGLIGDQTALRKSLDSGKVPSLILWGPPGCGKTSFARSLSQVPGYEFQQLNAVETGAKALREIGQAAGEKRRYYGTKSLVFIDEIHRLNKSQQDVLLPFVESGDITLIGATTENPSFEVNSALLSRCRLVRMESLSTENLSTILKKALESESVNAAELFEDETLLTFIESADGDARRLLTALESVLLGFKNQPQIFPLNSDRLSEFLGEKFLYFSKKGDDRFDLVSAFIKSIRGNDADAGLYYLARLIQSGEDVNFISRRLVILASEDVGNADPQGLVIATSAQQAASAVGLPEAGIILAQAVTYLATAPKSNRSYLGYKKALDLVSQKGNLPIPMAIRNAPNALMKKWGFGEGYIYSHDTPKGHSEDIVFLPEKIKNEKLYTPTNRGFELKIQKYLDWIKGR
jgi:putative ATPase